MRKPLAKTEPVPSVDVFLVKDEKVHLSTKWPVESADDIPCKLEGCKTESHYMMKRVVFRVSDGGRMPRVCNSCVLACPRARIVQSPPRKPKKEK